MTVSPAARDITVLVREMVALLATIIPLDVRRIETALSSANNPTDQARAAARTIIAQIAADIDSWIAIDDYQLLLSSAAAECFVEMLHDCGRFKLLIVSRERPTWATSRRFIHMEMIEFGAPDLAFDEGEATELLRGVPNHAALRVQARGWPAVIALAAQSGSAEIPLTADKLADSLYDYFAEELFEGSSETTKRLLVRLSLLPPLSPADLVAHLSEPSLVAHVASSGLVEIGDGLIAVHPLARRFLLEKLELQDDFASVVKTTILYCIDRHLWDETFELVKTHGVASDVQLLILASYEHLIEARRLGLLGDLGRYAASHGRVDQGLIDLITADIALNGGHFERAFGLGISASESLGDAHPLLARSLIVAGEAARLDHRLDVAAALHNLAMSAATTKQDRTAAAWGKCLAALTSEQGNPVELVREFNR